MKTGEKRKVGPFRQIEALKIRKKPSLGFKLHTDNLLYYNINYQTVCTKV